MTFLPLATCVLLGAVLCAAPVAAQSRGELLYTSSCVACHTTQIHWRDRRMAKDWDSLQAQVARWQAVGSLGWSDEDITAVTQYLNESYYGFKSPGAPPVVRTPASGKGR
ncbi:cytochrome C [Variovorax sp. YR216]|uniref:cytochrome C n=1 Tax=Variovorax sp. YR216 TaxID=1882828 RepID=UPI0008971947|nr:cytochrome C [Variovorax sp. YR216]SEB24377.1 hypothetical protein SAMN05444680_12038 [Variovorax sp. YR216]